MIAIFQRDDLNVAAGNKPLDEISLDDIAHVDRPIIERATMVAFQEDNWLLILKNRGHTNPMVIHLSGIGKYIEQK